MKTIIQDLGDEYTTRLLGAADQVIYANGHYAPCQGCFKCWTKHPASCEFKDVLQQSGRIIGASDDLIIISENCYGTFSEPVKAIIDRSIGMSTPFSTYRGGQMHHTLRYGKHDHYRVIVYGDISEAERETLRLMTKRNAINMGFREYSIAFCGNPEEVNNAIESGGKA